MRLGQFPFYISKSPYASPTLPVFVAVIASQNPATPCSAGRGKAGKGSVLGSWEMPFLQTVFLEAWCAGSGGRKSVTARLCQVIQMPPQVALMDKQPSKGRLCDVLLAQLLQRSGCLCEMLQVHSCENRSVFWRARVEYCLDSIPDLVGSFPILVWSLHFQALPCLPVKLCSSSFSHL